MLCCIVCTRINGNCAVWWKTKRHTYSNNLLFVAVDLKMLYSSLKTPPDNTEFGQNAHANYNELRALYMAVCSICWLWLCAKWEVFAVWRSMAVHCAHTQTQTHKTKCFIGIRQQWNMLCCIWTNSIQSMMHYYWIDHIISLGLALLII